MRLNGTEEVERAERAHRAISALTALTALSALSACARIEPPPGGPPDRAPPRLVSTRPATLSSFRAFKGVAEFQFDEVVSEGGAPNRGEGTGGLEKLIILSPTTRVPEVSWKRSRITVRPVEGWRANRVYRVELLPGVTDLRNNPSRESAVITFTTGAPKPQNTLEGRIVDWATSSPVPNGLVIATLLPDSLPYRGMADSSGHFSLGPLPSGDYLVTGVIDQNQNQRGEAREAFAAIRLGRGQSNAGELWAFVHDTTAPRIQTITVNDSVSATVRFSQQLDPRQRLTPGDVRLRLLPDSIPVSVSSLLPKTVDDSLHRRAAPTDTTGEPSEPRRTRGRESLPGRPPLFDDLVLRVARPWTPGSRLVLEVRRIRNVSGVAGNVVGVVAVPEKPKTTPSDSLKLKGKRDSTRVRAPSREPAAPPRK